ncbi:MAG: hypothetical protein U0163_06510 [Gemmatimonadaceae bacterium]
MRSWRPISELVRRADLRILEINRGQLAFDSSEERKVAEENTVKLAMRRVLLGIRRAPLLSILSVTTIAFRCSPSACSHSWR